MTTYGPWQDGPQETVPGNLQTAGRFRNSDDIPDAIHEGVTTASALHPLVQDARRATDGGAIGSYSFGGTQLYSSCDLRFASIGDGFDPYAPGVRISGVHAEDRGWFFYADYAAAWHNFRDTVVIAGKFASGADGFEIEGGDVTHVQSIDSASITIPMEVGTTRPDYPSTLVCDVNTQRALAYDDTSAAEVVRETRTLASPPIAGSVSQPPVSLTLVPGDFHPTNGGVRVHTAGRQFDALDWDVSSWVWGDGAAPDISFAASFPFAQVVTYGVTFPRYRYVFESAPPTPTRAVTRLYPRDDGRGLSSAARIYPPTKARRKVGGYR